MGELVRLVLQRERSDAERTFGELRFEETGARLVYTMEPGDADDFPRVAPGFYHCVPHEWQTGSTALYPRTWALVGAGVSHQKKPGVARSAILLHWGNWDQNTRGCVLCGLGRGTLSGEPALLESKRAVEGLRKILGRQSFYLTVREAA